MNTKAKIFIGVGIATLLIGGLYFTRHKWMPLFKKGDGTTPPADGGGDTGGGGSSTTDSTTTNTSPKPTTRPKVDSGQVGAKATNKFATISVYSVEVPLWQNIEDDSPYDISSAIVKYPVGSQNKKLGEVINTGTDKSGNKYYYLKLDTKVLKGGKTYWHGWVKSTLVSVK
jgi:hypothetical protein